MKTFALPAVCFLLMGCGPQEVPFITPQEYLTVINLEGEQETIPLDEFVDHRTGALTVKSILAIDRQTGKETWVAAERVRSDPPATARYIPVLRTQAELAGTEKEAQRF